MPVPRSEIDVALQEMPHGPRSVVPLEAVAVVEVDVAEERDLEPDSGPDARLELEGLDFLAEVPDVTGVEENHTVQGIHNRELLLKRVGREEPPARVADPRIHVAVDRVLHPRGGQAVDVIEHPGGHQPVVLVGHHRVAVSYTHLTLPTSDLV